MNIKTIRNIVFNHLIWSLVVYFYDFNSISIYLNVIYNRVRAVMLDTALQPYTDVADLYVIDPDGYIIRWQAGTAISNPLFIDFNLIIQFFKFVIISF